ncbi:DUF3592 domain-containing protein [Actinomadura verrucosospora]|uniref:DUF3592 domain-containing protein n=1 Tax=Actinomadura verrucosospora TaxID=46165 RepID=A0A7D3VUZ7_ACTVE|nr:DUF3592 domain-containing protein [Actinomadura verrucosospora]QKG20256.1 hypothetical protein ACTIVE_1894 [Actinomadura verrucosospora]
MIIAVVFAVFGVCFIWRAAADLLRKRAFARRAARGPGVVAGWEAESETSSAPSPPDHAGLRGAPRTTTTFTYFPVLEFRTADGREIRTRTDVGGWFPRREGREVAVLYDPEDPERARIDDFRGRGYFDELFFAVGGAAFTVIGLSALGWL